MGGPDGFLQPVQECSERLLELRAKLGLSQDTLARRVCLSAKQVQQLETGESGAFYSLSIRSYALKRVLALLEQDLRDLRAEEVLGES